MKIYGTMCVKNEADILAFTIPKILEWCDILFVVDNDSSDSTLDALHSYGDKVVVLGSMAAPFQGGFKSIGFNFCRASLLYQKPDWWAIVDADEVYVNSPRDFLENVPQRYGRVCINTCEFIGLRQVSDLICPESYEDYIPLTWAETRFFRETRKLQWCNYGDNGPTGARPVWPNRIKVHHFPFRSSDQVLRRIRARRKSKESSGIPWSNSMYADPEDLVANYKKFERVSVKNGVVFNDQAVNFRFGAKELLSRYVQLGLYFSGLR